MNIPRLVCAAAGAFLLSGSIVVQAQQPAKIHRIGFVSPTVPGPTMEAFRQGLKEVGYVEGKNVVIEARFVEGKFERFPAVIAEVLGSKVEVLVIGSTPGALAARKAAVGIPVVFAGVSDPVGPGIVASLAHPGGNITGATMGVAGQGFAGKWLQILKEALPRLSQVAVLSNPRTTANVVSVRELKTAAQTLKVKLQVFDAPNLEKLEGAFAAIAASPARGLIVPNDPLFFTHRARIVEFAASRRLPAMYFTKEFVEVGGLISYGASVAESYRRAAVQVDKILKGEKPSEIPIERPNNFELVINLKTAKALGLTIPPALMARADRFVE